MTHLTPLAGWCPACGTAQLHADTSGIVLCSFPGCPRPHAVHDLLTDGETAHLFESHGDGTFTLQHPLIERLDFGLFTCPTAARLAALDGPQVPPGRYRVRDDVVAGLLYEPLGGRS